MGRQQIRASILDITLPLKPAVFVLLVMMGGIIAIAPTAQAQTFQVIYTFTGHADGGQPQGPLVTRFHLNRRPKRVFQQPRLITTVTNFQVQMGTSESQTNGPHRLR